MADFKLAINGKNLEFNNMPDDIPLLWLLRDEAGLVGTKYGCGGGYCGSCTVHLDGMAIRSCSIPAAALEGRQITTIEGLAKGDSLHPLQQAWIDLDVPQCGYCQAGQIMNAAALLESNPAPDEAAIDRTMAGNLCRCGTYTRIKQAISQAATTLAYNAVVTTPEVGS
ncbi:MAG: isoquinoline 1-oxidoreductase alpha subunit [Alcanivorax sp.]|jgi:isoquinoline 1-oxidoreductase alpha subunit